MLVAPTRATFSLSRGLQNYFILKIVYKYVFVFVQINMSVCLSVFLSDVCNNCNNVYGCRLRMRSGVVIKQLSIGVASADQSYMPQLATVSVGKNVHTLREIKEVRIAR